MLGFTALLFACAATDRQDSAASDAPSARTLVYECSDMEFTARSVPAEMTLYLPDETRVLYRQPAGSGEKYSDGVVTLWSQGEEAVLEWNGRQYRSCRLNRARAPWEEARRRGVDFRAVGQEPAWYLELQHDQSILFVTDYGARRVLLPAPEPELLDDLESYRVSDGAHELRLDITLEHCVDTMSGEAYDSSVELTLNGRRYRGCGASLEHPWE